MATLLDIKNFVSNQLGNDDGSVDDPIRDRFINQARRKFYSETRWFFLQKSTVPSWSSGVAALPSDYNHKYDPADVYVNDGGLKISYRKVELGELDAYPDVYCYAIDQENNEIKINQVSATPTLAYYYLPADYQLNSTQNSDVEPIQDITIIAWLSIAYYWLASERSTARYQLFMDMYKEELNKLKLMNAQKQPVRQVKSLRLDFGYSGARQRTDFDGYVPKG